MRPTPSALSPTRSCFSLSWRNRQRGHSSKMLCRSPSQGRKRCSRNPSSLGQAFQLLAVRGRALLGTGTKQKSRSCQGRARREHVELLRDTCPSRVPGLGCGTTQAFQSRSEVEVPLTCAPAAGTAPAQPIGPHVPAPKLSRPIAIAGITDGAGRGRRSSPPSSGTTIPRKPREAAGRIAPQVCPRRATVAAGGGGCQAVTAGGTRPGCCCCCCRDAAGAAAASQADAARPWTSKRGPASSSATITITTPSSCRRRRAGRGWSRARRRQRRRPRRRQQEEAAEEGESQPPEPPRHFRRPGLNTACRASCISCSTSGAASRRSAPSGRRSGRSCR